MKFFRRGGKNPKVYNGEKEVVSIHFVIPKGRSEQFMKGGFSMLSKYYNSRQMKNAGFAYLGYKINNEQDFSKEGLKKQ